MRFSFLFKDEKHRYKIITMTIGICIIIIVVLFLYQHDIFGVKSSYEKSYLYTRLTYHNAGDLAGNDRIDKKYEYVRNASKYLFGGNYLSKVEGFGYAHELWLDIYDDAGAIPYIMMVLYSIISGTHFIKVGKDQRVDHNWRIVIITMLIIIMLQFFVEPILSGSPMILYSFIIMDGALARWLYDKKNLSK